MLHLSLRSRILNLFLVMSFITVAGGTGMLWYTRATDRLLVSMVHTEIALYKAAQDMETALANQKGFLTYYFLDGQAKWLEALAEYREIFQKSLDKALELGLTTGQREALEKIHAQYQGYIRAKDHVIEVYRVTPENERESISRKHQEQRAIFFSLLDQCRAFSNNQWALIQEAEVKNTTRSRSMRLLAGGALAFYLVLCISLIYILYRHVLEPIRSLAIETGSSPRESLRDEVVSLSHSLKGMMRDFDETHSELARSRKHLVQAERMAMVGELAAGVAHTIRNPFTSIKMRMFSLSRSLDLTDVQNEDLQVISDEIARIDKIVQSFLEFARPPKLKLTLCRMDRIIDSVSTLLEYRLNAHSVELFYTPNPDLPEIEVDPDRIKEALVNIVTNACEAMEDGGRIVIVEKLTRDDDLGDVVRISIQDTGPGIPEPILAKITNPFFTTKEDGSGLGLSIVTRIVREHQGKLTIAQAPGQGAEFIIVLPITRLAHESDSDH